MIGGAESACLPALDEEEDDRPVPQGDRLPQFVQVSPAAPGDRVREVAPPHMWAQHMWAQHMCAEHIRRRPRPEEFSGRGRRHVRRAERALLDAQLLVALTAARQRRRPAGHPSEPGGWLRQGVIALTRPADGPSRQHPPGRSGP